MWKFPTFDILGCLPISKLRVSIGQVITWSLRRPPISLFLSSGRSGTLPSCASSINFKKNKRKKKLDRNPSLCSIFVTECVQGFSLDIFIVIIMIFLSWANSGEPQEWHAFHDPLTAIDFFLLFFFFLSVKRSLLYTIIDVPISST